MPIDYTRLRGLTVHEIQRALERDGFSLARQKGATRFFKHDDGRRVTLHVHRRSQTLPIGTLRESLNMKPTGRRTIWNGCV